MAPQFNNSYVNLPERFYVRQAPVPVADPTLIRVNHELAQLLGIDPAWLESAEGVATIAGNHLPEGTDPIATVYAGHQFGSWNPRLGDGRAGALASQEASVRLCDGVRQLGFLTRRSCIQHVIAL